MTAKAKRDQESEQRQEVPSACTLCGVTIHADPKDDLQPLCLLCRARKLAYQFRSTSKTRAREPTGPWPNSRPSGEENDR